MSLDLLAYARERRLRVWKLHEGAPVWPTRRRAAGAPVAYPGGAADGRGP